MKRILPYLLTLFSLVAVWELEAQPTFYMPCPLEVNNGDQIVVPVRYKDFTNLLVIRFSLDFDPSVLTFTGFGNLNPNIADFDITDLNSAAAGTGILTLDWSTNTAGTGVTRPDDEVMFEMRFNVIGAQADFTNISITNSPVDIYVTRQNAFPLNINLFNQDGCVSIGTAPVYFIAPFVTGNSGETVCVEMTLKDFTQISAFQTGLSWNPMLLTFQSVTTSGLPNFPASSVNSANAASGSLTIGWFNGANPVSVADGTVFLTVCFTVNGFCGQRSDIRFGPLTGFPQEAVKTFPSGGFLEIGIINRDGQLTVNCNNPNGLTVCMGDANVCPGENFCIPVRVRDFTDIKRMEYSIRWNPDFLQFTGTQNLASVFGFNAASFNTSSTGSGALSLRYRDVSCFGQDLPQDAILFNLCFKVIGGSGSSTSVSISNDPTPVFITRQCGSTPSNIGINACNATVNICRPTGLTVNIGDNSGFPTESNICVPVTVANFTNLSHMGFSIGWEPSVIEFLNVTGPFGVPGMGVNDFFLGLTSTGSFCVDWDSTNPLGTSVPDNTVLFNLCYKMVGTPGACSPLEFFNLPCEINVTTASTGNVNVGISPNPGEICIDNPVKFGIAIEDENGNPGAEVCLDFVAENFTELTTMNFTVDYNNAVLTYSQMTNPLIPGFTAANIAPSGGALVINWDAGAPTGVTLPNGTVMFQLCFTLSGDGGDCTSVFISNQPQEILVNTVISGPVNIGIDETDGNICINNGIGVTAVVTNESCPNLQDGMINLTVQGGSGNFSYSWNNDAFVTEDLTNLGPGTYCVNVVDNNDPQLVAFQCYTIRVDAAAPVAVAGSDINLRCGQITFTLDGSQSSQGMQYLYFWRSIGCSGATVFNPLQAVAMGTSPCRYLLEVTDTGTGCVARDTILVVRGQATAANAGLDSVFLTCTNDTITVMAEQVAGGNTSFTWASPNGVQIVPGTQNSLNPKVFTPGTLIFEVTNNNNGCLSSDTVTVVDLRTDPVAFAGDDTDIDCSQPMISIGGPPTTTGANITYLWTTSIGSIVAGTETLVSASVNGPGTYTLLVTDTSNGCTATDDILVDGDTQRPVANAGLDKPIYCNTPTVTLEGAGSSIGAPGEYAYLWTRISGTGVITNANMLNATTNGPGTYQLAVTDVAGNCTSTDRVIITNGRIAPQVEAGNYVEINCTTPLRLNGSHTNSGNTFTFFWTSSNGFPIQDSTTLMPLVRNAGKYFLTITSTISGCTGIDSVSVGQAPNNIIAQAGSNQIITCTQTTVTLSSAGSTTGATIQRLWTGPTPCTNGVTPNFAVNCPGLYTLIITDTSNGCTASDTVRVTRNVTVITPVAIANGRVTCLNNQVPINTMGSNQGTNIRYLLRPTAPNTVTNGTTAMPTAVGGGNYWWVVSDISNGCKDSIQVNVPFDTIRPVSNAGMDQQLDCQVNNFMLNGSGSGSGANITYNWAVTGGGSIVAGQNTQQSPEGMGVGTYTLTVTNSMNGCSATDQTIVTRAPNPVANAGADSSIPCDGSTVNLSGTGSATGATIVYQWTTTNGDIIGDPNSLSPEIGTPGTYFIEVTDNNTACVGRDTVQISFAGGIPAQASFTREACTIDATLTGNLPAGATGVWTSLGSAMIIDSTINATTVTELEPGANRFVWTLSAPGCPEYSADTMVITTEVTPVANDDIFIIPAGTTTSTFNPLTNDVFTAGQVNLTLTGNSGFVTTVVNGVNIEATRASDFQGIGVYQYKVCSSLCTDLCDEGQIIINVEGDVKLPNAITPNGDGKNDALIFDQLLANPDKYPDNSIIIFNRWGDVVYSSAPYTNDWKGDNMSGKSLPEATYYYILRLNVGESEIINGNVTILR